MSIYKKGGKGSYSHITQNQGTQAADAGLSAVGSAIPVVGAFAAVGKGISGAIAPQKQDGTQNVNSAGVANMFNPSAGTGYLVGEGEWGKAAMSLVNPFGAGKQVAKMKNNKIRKEQQRESMFDARAQSAEVYGDLKGFKPTLYKKGGKLEGGDNGDPSSWIDDGKRTPGAPVEATAAASNATYNYMKGQGAIGDGRNLKPQQLQPVWGKAITGTVDPYTGEQVDYETLKQRVQAAGPQKFRDTFMQEARNQPHYASPDAYLQWSFDQGRSQINQQAHTNPTVNQINPAAQQILQQQNSLNVQQGKDFNQAVTDKAAIVRNGLTTLHRSGGRILGGKLHKQGGNPVLNSQGQVVAETEKGELLLDARATAQAEGLYQQEGNSVAPIQEGQRIVSRKDTKKLSMLSRKKNDQQLGRLMRNILQKQDNQQPEYK